MKSHGEFVQVSFINTGGRKFQAEVYRSKGGVYTALVGSMKAQGHTMQRAIDSLSIKLSKGAA